MELLDFGVGEGAGMCRNIRHVHVCITRSSVVPHEHTVTKIGDGNERAAILAVLYDYAVPVEPNGVCHVTIHNGVMMPLIKH